MSSKDNNWLSLYKSINQEERCVSLSKEDAEIIFKALINPPAPNKAALRAVKNYKKMINKITE